MNVGMLETIALAEVALCAAVWTGFILAARRRTGGLKKAVRAPASRWGIILQTAGLALALVYLRPAGFEKSPASLMAAMVLAPPSAALACWATRHLGKQWRYEAALSEDHELIQDGPYGWVRHPIYTAMLGMLMAVGAAWTWWPIGVAGLMFFVAGTEIRARAEDRLLAERFGEAFAAYRRRVRAYIPLVR